LLVGLYFSKRANKQQLRVDVQPNREWFVYKASRSLYYKRITLLGIGYTNDIFMMEGAANGLFCAGLEYGRNYVGI
jgi:hypothetical protein